MVNIYKKKYGMYKLIGTAKSEKYANSILRSHYGKGKYRIGKSSYITEL